MGKASLWHGNAPGECNNGAGVGRLKIATPFIVLPSLPSAVAEWLPPTAWGGHQRFPGHELDGNQSQRGQTQG